MQITYTFHVTGMHCKACVLMTESALEDVPYVSMAKTDLKTRVTQVTGDFGDKTPEQIAESLSTVLREHGYSLSVEKNQNHNKNWGEFKIAFPVALIFIVFFIALQKLGIVNLLNASDVSYGTAFFIGIIASLSTCMAVVGGLLLSMSATFAREGDRIRPQLLFHGGRMISFFILGGVIGMIGSAFALSISATFLLSMLIGVIMLILGINLLDIFHFSKKWQPSMPKFLSRHALGISKLNHRITPLLVGVATFFLPCGFTQSMQIYTLSTGSFLQGGLTMLVYALGTLPVLSIISFSSLGIRQTSRSGIFFKSAGLIVIMFALFNIINSFVIIGLIPPIFNF